MRVPPLVWIVAILASALASCSSLKPATLPYDKLESPGFFDIGVGYGRVTDTRSTANDDSQGLVASFKAYPLGRWYAEPKDSTRESEVRSEDRVAVASLLAAEDDTRRALKSGGGRLDATSTHPRKREFEEAYDQVVSLNRFRYASLAPEVVSALRTLEAGTCLANEERKVLSRFSTGVSASPKWHVVEERDAWYNRFSVFYGRSVSDFDSGGLQSEVNAVGLAYDISPDLCLQVGWSFYEVDETGLGQIDSDSSFFFGVSLNLYAFKSLGEAILGVGN